VLRLEPEVECAETQLSDGLRAKAPSQLGGRTQQEIGAVYVRPRHVNLCSSIVLVLPVVPATDEVIGTGRDPGDVKAACLVLHTGAVAGEGLRFGVSCLKRDPHAAKPSPCSQGRGSALNESSQVDAMDQPQRHVNPGNLLVWLDLDGNGLLGVRRAWVVGWQVDVVARVTWPALPALRVDCND